MNLKKRFSMEKLVRDKIIEFFENEGAISHTTILSKEALIKALKYKLIEESEEVFSSQDRENLIEELADLREVVLSLMKASNITESAVEEKRQTKKEMFGSFEKGYYFYCVDMPIESPEINYFLKNPEKYPEIEIKKRKNE